VIQYSPTEPRARRSPLWGISVKKGWAKRNGPERRVVGRAWQSSFRRMRGLDDPGSDLEIGHSEALRGRPGYSATARCDKLDKIMEVFESEDAALRSYAAQV
jgi:hypothetical protein